MAESNGEQLQTPATPKNNKPGIIASLFNQFLPEPPKILSRKETKRIKREEFNRQREELKAKKWEEVYKMAKEKRAARLQQAQSEQNGNQK